jgi:hypothetical protein
VCRSGKGAIGPPVGMNVVGSIKRSGVDTDKKISEGPIIKEMISHIRVVWVSSEILVSKLRPVELRDMLNQSKDKKGLNQKRDDDLKKSFRCQEMGHHQKDSVNQRICYKCKEEGYMAAECVEFHAKSEDLKMFGFALPD